MKISSVINQIKMILPKYTDLFSENENISSLVYSAGSVTANVTGHDVAVGDSINIKGAYSPNLITSITRIDNVATAITSQPHDLTEDYQTEVIISGATETEYNGSKTLLSVDSKYQFTFTVTGTPTTPATGTIFLNETRDNQYNGTHTVTSVVDDDNFKYSISSAPYNDASGTPILQKSIRISGVASEDRIQEVYTAQSSDKWWAFVLFENTFANKNRQIQNDATYRVEAGVDYRQQLIHQFSVYTICPTSDEVSGINAVDDINETIRKYLFKSLLGVKFESGFSEDTKYGTTFVNDEVAAYQGAYYIHKFTFESVYNLNSEDIVEPDSSVAWRDFDMDYKNIQNDDTIKQDTGKIDF